MKASLQTAEQRVPYIKKSIIVKDAVLDMCFRDGLAAIEYEPGSYVVRDRNGPFLICKNRELSPGYYLGCYSDSIV